MASSPLKPKLVWKGKAKATEPTQDFDDLNPIITYRHILSQTLGVRDPLRVIALCDSDAFYAACEMVRLGVEPETPLVVLQWDSLIAVNYPARRYGISRMDKKKDALKRCPHLQLVHVATFKEGEKEPGYWDDVDTNTHKVCIDCSRIHSLSIYLAVVWLRNRCHLIIIVEKVWKLLPGSRKDCQGVSSVSPILTTIPLPLLNRR